MNMPLRAPPNLKHAATDFRLDAVDDEGVFSGYLAVYGNVDSYGDRIRPGAFRASLKAAALKKRKFPVLWQHDWNEPIGVFEELTEDDGGLYVNRGRLLTRDIPRAAHARALMLADAITGMSIGFDVVDEKAGKDGVNELIKLNLWEGSIVTFPANDDARVDTVKSALADGTLPSIANFEGILRDAGFSKMQATAIASRGYAHLLRRSESGSEKAIESALALLRGVSAKSENSVEK